MAFGDKRDMNHYFVLRLNNIPADLEDSLASLLFESGASGVSEDLEFEQTVQQFEPAVVLKDRKNILAYFSEAPAESLLDQLAELQIAPRSLENVSSPHWEIQKEQEADWLKEWKKGYTALTLAEDFWIVPRWEEPPKEAKIAFHIEPGMAFGTGTHETTQLVVELMAKMEAEGSFLDVGAGTGLLAFYAHRRGFKRVVAIDNDPVAVEVARENLIHNRAAEIEISATPLESVVETFDVVAANIIQSVLLHLHEGLVKSVKAGGELLLSGVLKDHEDEFVSAFFSRAPFEVVERLEKGEWVAFRARRIGE